MVNKNDNKVKASEMAMLIVVMIWGLGFVITKYALDLGFSSSVLNTSRFIVASIVLSIIFHKKLLKLNRITLITGFITGILFFLSFQFQTLGAIYTTPSKNAFITQLNIFLVPIVYYFFFKKSVKKKFFYALPIALIGLFVFFYDDGFFKGVNKGDLYTLLCAVFLSLQVVLSDYFQKKNDLDPVQYTMVNMYTAALLGIIVCFFDYSVPSSISIETIWPSLFLGVFNTAICFGIQSVALKYSNAATVSIIVCLEAVFGSLFGYLFLDDPMTLQLVLGGLIIIGAVAIVEVDLGKKKKNTT